MLFPGTSSTTICGAKGFNLLSSLDPVPFFVILNICYPHRQVTNKQMNLKFLTLTQSSRWSEGTDSFYTVSVYLRLF